MKDVSTSFPWSIQRKRVEGITLLKSIGTMLACATLL